MADVDPELQAAIDRAAAAIDEGGLAIYPTETVYGLGANAVDPDAVERVFEVKGRDRSKPVSLGVPDVETALDYVDPDDRTDRFLREFLPGPVTVVCERRPVVPDVLTAGSDRVGIRVPNHEVALGLLAEFAPITATSANRSGAGSARQVDDVSASVRESVAAVVDAGETPGGDGSTVVDVSEGVIHRRGPLAGEIESWLERTA
jgi:L-threonylcarbamoyladenylate synthase